MSQLQVEIAAGTESGRRVVLRPGAAVTFGRATGNTLVIDLPFISREHGELRWVASGKAEGEGSWLLANKSPHGTFLDKKRVTRKPRAVVPPQTILVGEEPVLRVLAEVEGDANVYPQPRVEGGQRPSGERREEADEAPPPQQAGLTGRAKLWIGIGVYMTLMLGAFLFVTLNRGTTQARVDAPPDLTPTQIEAFVREPLPEALPSPRLVIEVLAEAEQHRRVASDRALVLAHRAYGRALSMTPGPVLDDALQQKHFEEVQKAVVQEVQRRYAEALAYSKAGAWESAAPAFRDLYEFYDDPGSPIFDNAQRQSGYASRRLGEKRRK